jgi:hypothetical protein
VQQHAQRRINMPQEEGQITGRQSTRRDAERKDEVIREQHIQAREINGEQKEHQERCVPTDLLVQRLASSKTLMKKSTVRSISYLQWKKCAYFDILSNSKE